VAVKVRRYQTSDAQPIARLNQRLRAAGVSEVVFPEGAEQLRGGTIRERLFVADDDGEIRGGVWLKEQSFRVQGEDALCGWLKYPVAESLIDSRFSSVPGSLLMQCLREQPRLMALGLGGHETPLARMLKALKWRGESVPMLVRLVRPARCLRSLAALRRTAGRRVAADFLAASGLAWLGLKAFDIVRRARFGSTPRGYTAERCDVFGPWADALWERTRDDYGLVACRDAATLESMLPASSDVNRLRIRFHGDDIGWATVLRHDFSVGPADRHFGTLSVGLIADVMAAPAHARGVIATAHHFLSDASVHLVFSNQLHPAWGAALRASGFVTAPSNFAFYASPGAARHVKDWNSLHITRGDCDGPMWYAAR
jgi:hypothetical protein